MFKRSTPPSPTADTPAPGLRPGLRWALGLSAAASAWALLSPADPPLVAATAPSPAGQSLPATPAPRPPIAAATSRPGAPAPLPAVPPRLPEHPLEPADRDPFSIPQPPAPPPPPPLLRHRRLPRPRRRR